MSLSLQAGSPQQFPEWQASFVDGAGGKSVFPRMWERMHGLVDGSIVVTLEETKRAIRLMAEKARVIAEGAGALPVAAALTGKAGQGPIVAIVSGGNIDLDKFAEFIASRKRRSDPVTSARSYASQRSRFAFTKSSSVSSGYAASTRSISFICPGDSSSFGSRHHRPRSNPCRAQHFMDPGDASPESVRRIEDRAVRVGRRGAKAEEPGRHRAAAHPRHPVDHPHRGPGPVRPVAQQSAGHPQRHHLAPARKAIGRQQVRHDVVVIAGEQRDLALPPRIGHRAHHVQRGVPVERRDLDRHHLLDLDEAAPEPVRQRPSARPMAAGRTPSAESSPPPRGSAPPALHPSHAPARRGSAVPTS